MTMPDDLTPARLAEIEAQNCAHENRYISDEGEAYVCQVVRDLCAAVRAAWAERDQLRASDLALRSIIARIHLAMGEAPESDDETLPDFVETFVREHRHAVAQLDAERNEWKRRAEEAEQRERETKTLVLHSLDQVTAKQEEVTGNAVRFAEDVTAALLETRKERDSALALVAEIRGALEYYQTMPVVCGRGEEAQANHASMRERWLRAESVLSLPAPEALARLTARIEARVWGEARALVSKVTNEEGDPWFVVLMAVADDFNRRATAAQARAEGRP